MEKLQQAITNTSTINELYDLLMEKDIEDTIRTLPVEVAEPGDVSAAKEAVSKERYIINGTSFKGTQMPKIITQVIAFSTCDKEVVDDMVANVLTSCSLILGNLDSQWFVHDLFQGTDAWTVRSRNVTARPIVIRNVDNTIQVLSTSTFEIFSSTTSSTVVYVDVELIASIELPLMQETGADASASGAPPPNAIKHFVQLGPRSVSTATTSLPSAMHAQLATDTSLHYESRFPACDNLPLGITFSQSHGLIHVDWVSPFYKRPDGMICAAQASNMISRGDVLITVNDIPVVGVPVSVACAQVLSIQNSKINVLVFVKATRMNDLTPWNDASTSTLPGTTFTCSITRGPRGLGLNFVAYVEDETHRHIMVCKKDPFVTYEDDYIGPAQRDGKVSGGDILETVDGILLKGRSFTEIAAIFSSLDSPVVVLGFRKKIPLLEKESVEEETIVLKLGSFLQRISSAREEGMTNIASPINNLMRNFSGRQLLGNVTRRRSNPTSTSSVVTTEGDEDLDLDKMNALEAKEENEAMGAMNAEEKKAPSSFLGKMTQSTRNLIPSRTTAAASTSSQEDNDDDAITSPKKGSAKSSFRTSLLQRVKSGPAPAVGKFFSLVSTTPAAAYQDGNDADAEEEKEKPSMLKRLKAQSSKIKLPILEDGLLVNLVTRPVVNQGGKMKKSTGFWTKSKKENMVVTNTTNDDVNANVVDMDHLCNVLDTLDFSSLSVVITHCVARKETLLNTSSTRVIEIAAPSSPRKPENEDMEEYSVASEEENEEDTPMLNSSDDDEEYHCDDEEHTIRVMLDTMTSRVELSSVQAA